MPLSDEIDTSIPANNVAVDKAELRANTVAIKDAIAATERQSSIARQIMYGIRSVTE